MPSADVVSSLIALIYDATLEPARWPIFLHAFANAVGGTSTQLLFHDARGNAGAIGASVHLDAEAQRLYDQHFVAMDPWLQNAKHRGVLVPGRVHIGEELIPRANLVATAYYNDFARRFQLTRSLAAVIRLDVTTLSSISSIRPDHRDAFGEEERRLVEILMPHLQRAMQVHRRLATLQVAHDALADALEGFSTGVLIVRSDSTLLYANAVGSRLLAARDGISLDRRGLKASVAAETRALRALIHAAARTSAGGDGGSGGALSISRSARPSRHPLYLLVTPIRAEQIRAIAGSQDAAAVFVTDVERTGDTDAEAVGRLWGLTATEGQIAGKLAAGLSPREISEELAITRNTVRWHVKHVLAKTHTCRQSELVRVLSATAAVIAARRR